MLKNFIWNKLRVWLGIESLQTKVETAERQTSNALKTAHQVRKELNDQINMVGVDHLLRDYGNGRAQTNIIVISAFNGGSINVIQANFKDGREVRQYVAELREIFKNRVIADPAEYFPDERKRR